MGLEVLALGEMCFGGMGHLQRGLRYWHWVKYVLRAWGQSEGGFHVLAPGEMCVESMEAVEKGVSRVGTG